MKRKDEERLIKLAFGELEGHSGVADRPLSEDAEAAKFVAEFEELRQGLKQLAGPVPEHQLSSERLRDAILKQGLKERKPAGLGWRWTFAPIAVMGCAFLITLKLNQDPNVLPEGFAGIGPDVLTQPSPLGTEPISPRFDPPSREASNVPVPAPAPSAVNAPSVSATRSSTAGLTASLSGARRTDRSANAERASMALTPADFSNLAIDGALPAGAVAMIDGNPDEGSIVIISSDIDDATGAKRATEVTSTSNVVIGG